MQFARVLETSKNLEKDYIELVIPFTNPIDIFVRYRDILTEARFVYFFGYRMGKERIIFWGVYDDERKEVIIDSGCNDIKFQLSKLIKQWKTMGYEHVGAEQRDNFNQRLNYRVLYQGSLDYETLVKELTLMAWLRGEITDYDLLERKYYISDTEKRFTQDDMIDYQIKLEKEAEYNEMTLDELLTVKENQYNPYTKYSGEKYHISDMGAQRGRIVTARETDPLPFNTNLEKEAEYVQYTGQSDFQNVSEKEKVERNMRDVVYRQFIYRPITTYGQYKKLKQNIEKKEFFTEVDENNQKLYMQFLHETQIVPFEKILHGFTYRPIITYDQYKKLKYNIERWQHKLKASRYPYSEKTWQAFLDELPSQAHTGEKLYVDFLYDTQIVAYENNLNFITIDEKVLRELNTKQYQYLLTVVVKLRRYLEKTNIVDKYKGDLCPPSIEECKLTTEGVPKGCEIYYYGKQIRYPEDIDYSLL